MSTGEVKKHEVYSLFKGGFSSYVVGIYLFCFYLELHNRISVLQSIRFQFIFGALVGLICFSNFLKNKKTNLMTSATKSAFAMIFLLGIYTVFSFDPEVSETTYIDRVVKFSLVSFFIYASVNKISDLRIILFFMLLAWLKIGQEGLYGWITGGMVWENQGIPRLHGVTVMFAHPNSYSGFAVGCLPFCMYFLPCVKSNLFRIGLFSLLICSLVIIVSTGSRTGYLATSIWFLYYLSTLNIGKGKIVLAVMLAVFVTVSVVPGDYQERFGSIFTGEEREGRSSEKRKEIIFDAIEVFKEYPMGVGVSAFPKVRGEIFGRSQDTHNLYLEVLTNVGFIGLLVFFIFIYQLIVIGRDNSKRINSKNLYEPDRKFLLSLNTAVLNFLILRLLLGFFGMDLYEIYWWLILGYFLAINKLLRIEEKA